MIRQSVHLVAHFLDEARDANVPMRVDYMVSGYRSDHLGECIGMIERDAKAPGLILLDYRHATPDERASAERRHA